MRKINEAGGVNGNPENAGIDVGKGFVAPRLGLSYRVSERTVVRAGGGLTSDPNANSFGNFTSRYNFENGWFIGSERGNLNWGLNNFTPVSAFGSPTSFSYEGGQVGYNFKSAPVSVFAGFDSVKYSSPIASPFTALDSMSANSTPGYRVNAGVEFRPTSNLSLSVGASFSQQPNDLNSALLPGASPFGYRGR